MANKRIYVVTCAETAPKPKRLVRAASAAQAIKHVTQPEFGAEVATPDDCFQLGKSGIEIEEASE